MTPGAAQLASLDADRDRLRLASVADVETALAKLRAVSSVVSRAVLLGEWVLAYPRATSQLLRVIARDQDTAAEFAPSVLAARVLDRDDADDILAAAFPKLTGAYREAAADRDGVRRQLGIAEPISVGRTDPAWQWPSGKPFPAADTVAGVQARLNYLDIGAGAGARSVPLTRHVLDASNFIWISSPRGGAGEARISSTLCDVICRDRPVERRASRAGTNDSS